MSSWFRDKKEESKLPERLKGKTPEQVAKELEDADKLKNDLELEKAARRESDESVQQIRTEFDQVKERLAAADASRNKPPEKREPLTMEQFMDDPEGHVRRISAEANAPATGVTVANAAQTARILAQQQLDNADLASGGKSMDGRLFRAWGAELNSESAKYNAVQLIKPEAWLGIFYYLKGVHSDELRDPEMRKKKYNFLEPSGSGAPPPADNKKSDELTDAEKHVADKMGVSYENYAKRKKGMQYVNA
jgi:hypothetical protein